MVASAEKQGEYATLIATGAVVHVRTMMRTYKNDHNKSLGLYAKYTCLDFTFDNADTGIGIRFHMTMPQYRYCGITLQ